MLRMTIYQTRTIHTSLIGNDLSDTNTNHFGGLKDSVHKLASERVNLNTSKPYRHQFCFLKLARNIVSEDCIRSHEKKKQLEHFPSEIAHGNSEFLEKFLGRIFQFLYTCKSSCDFNIYNISDYKYIARCRETL